MARVDMRMSAEQIDSFLRRCPSMVVTAVDDDGEMSSAVAATAMNDGALVLEFAEHDPVIDLIGDGRKIACVADESPSYYEIQGVMVHGVAVAQPGSDTRFAIDIDEIVSFDFGKITQRMQ
ncbi:MAG: hypothetical protein AB7V43_14225 [Acidimicrobiia bacterium]